MGRLEHVNIASVVLHEADGSPVALGELLERPTLLVAVRYFG